MLVSRHRSLARLCRSLRPRVEPGPWHAAVADDIAIEMLSAALRSAGPILIALALLQPFPASAQEARGRRLGPYELLGDGPPRLSLGLGVFDTFSEASSGTTGQRSAAALVDLRLGRKLLGLGPAVGVLLNSDGGRYSYGAVYADLAVERWILSPLLGAGYWRRGGSKDLGGPFALRLEVTIAYELASGARLGLRWGHLSNAYLYSENPSQEDYTLTLSLPLQAAPAARAQAARPLAQR
jgi:hypothetical protein